MPPLSCGHLPQGGEELNGEQRKENGGGALGLAEIEGTNHQIIKFSHFEVWKEMK